MHSVQRSVRGKSTQKPTFNSCSPFPASHSCPLTFFHENTAQNKLAACEHGKELQPKGGTNLYFKDETSSYYWYSCLREPRPGGGGDWPWFLEKGRRFRRFDIFYLKYQGRVLILLLSNGEVGNGDGKIVATVPRMFSLQYLLSRSESFLLLLSWMCECASLCECLSLCARRCQRTAV